jgi:PilZ domain
MDDERPRRLQKRIQLGGDVRLILDTPAGLITTAGQIIDLSEGGCALRVHLPVDAQMVGRVHVEVAGKKLGLPIVTRWTRADSRGWTVGCQFDRPTAEKRQAIRALMLEQRRLTV